MNTLSNSIGNFDLFHNVKITVLDYKHEVKQIVHKHNKANMLLIQGILKFLRGEFNPSNITNSSIYHNVNGAKIYIPSYISFGNGGVGSETVVPDYSSTMLQNELVSDIYGRLPISKSQIGTGSPGDSGQLQLITYVPQGYYYHFNTNPIATSMQLTEVGLFSSDYDGSVGSSGKMLARLVLDEPIEQTENDVMLVQWYIGAVSIDDDFYYKGKKGTSNSSWTS